MGTIIDLEPKYNNSYFGDIKSIVWFEVTENYGPFSIEMRIEKQRDQPQLILITNTNNTNTIVWNKEFEASSNPTPVTELITIWHNPQSLSEVYSIQNV